MLLIPCRIHGTARRRARVEIIPLIDVIFFLLATFVLFTLSMSLIRALPVVLPRGGESVDRPEAVTIQVSGDGALFWNRELIEAAEVPGRLAHYKATSREPRVLVTGDERARFGATIALLDEVKRAGIDTVSVETRTRPTAR
jgi:biopolymer transport protein ExbD